VPADYLNGKEVLLVFDGIKMGADIYLNNHLVNTTSDQFLRYSFPVKSLLSIHGNTLSVVFRTSVDPLNSAESRWMQCSGGWDWAPYGTTFSLDGSHTMTKGIHKSVYLVPITFAALTGLVPQIVYTGVYPSVPLSDGAAQPFNVSVTLHLDSLVAFTANITIGCDWSVTTPFVSRTLPIAAGVSRVTLTLPSANHVKLWWPLDLGLQTRYAFNVTFSSVTNPELASVTHRQVGFRVVYLVTTNDSQAPNITNGSGDLTMRFKVNGCDLWSRGANMIPMEEFEGRQSPSAYQALLQSVADAHFNTLRVWGGGVYLPPIFYDTCDELGIMVFQDLMFGQPWMGGSCGTPQNTPMQTAEIQYNVRNLASHPSIALWNGGNEWQGALDVWESFVFPTLVAEDSSRPVWPISPSAGWSSGVDTRTGLPNGQPLIAKPSGNIETHGPYQHGSGFATVNGDGTLTPFPAQVPPTLQPSTTAYGPSQPGSFASEFGCSVFSSFESMAPTLVPADWTPHAQSMTQRNYPCDSIVQVYFGRQPDLNTTVGSQAILRKATFLCMVGQSLEMKADIENRRSQNAFGTLTWQANEIWPTGGNAFVCFTICMT
jgi:beta-mannosidase